MEPEAEMGPGEAGGGAGAEGWRVHLLAQLPGPSASWNMKGLGSDKEPRACPARSQKEAWMVQVSLIRPQGPVHNLFLWSLS